MTAPSSSITRVSCRLFALVPLALLGCSPSAPPADSIEESEPLTVQSVAEKAGSALAARERAFALVERQGDEVVRRGRILLRVLDEDTEWFDLTWEGDPPRRVTSDGVGVYATRPEGGVWSGSLDRAGSVLREQQAGKLLMAAIRPGSFGRYGGEVMSQDDGRVRLRSPLPNGGGWEMEVTTGTWLPREVFFQGAPEAEPQVVVLEEVEAEVPEEPAAFRLEPDPGEELVEFFVGPAPGEMAPAVTFELADGSTVALADLQGSVVVLDFWATWCMPCRPAMKELEELYQELAGEGLEVYGLRLYDQGDPQAFLESLGVTYPIGDGKNLAEPYAIDSYGLPTLYVIDRQGLVSDLVVGYNAELTPPKLRQAILAALG